MPTFSEAAWSDREWLLHKANLRSKSGSAAKSCVNLNKKTALRFSLSSALTQPNAFNSSGPHTLTFLLSDYDREVKA